MSETTSTHGASDTAAAPALETSWIPRFVALLTPLFAAAAGWMAGVVAQYVPGVVLDQAQITTFMVTAAAAAGSSAWKWLTGWQQHERMVAEGYAAPVARQRYGNRPTYPPAPGCGRVVHSAEIGRQVRSSPNESDSVPQ